MNTLTIDEKLDEIERFLIDSIHSKVSQGDPLNTLELQLITRWLKSRDSVGKPKKPKETSVVPEVMSGGDPLPFITKKETLEEALEEYENL